jgi:hypothetical protein
MPARLWHMNADFEAELAHRAARPAAPYRRNGFLDSLNRRLASRLLWLAREGDALLLEGPCAPELRERAQAAGVRLLSPGERVEGRVRFEPWGWTESAVEAARRAGAEVSAPPLDVVARVNSKLWSHALEVELGVRMPGAVVAQSFEELERAAAAACPRPGDKWVVKSPFGFAARDRVLGRGPRLDEPSAKWARRRIEERGEALVFQPWLEVVREYGVVMEISREGEVAILGFSDVQANGAGTATGYLLGRPPAPRRARELEEFARLVGARLAREGYFGPAGLDALEHAGGLHPLLEVNARRTMGFVALAVERATRPAAPTVWEV